MKNNPQIKTVNHILSTSTYKKPISYMCYFNHSDRAEGEIITYTVPDCISHFKSTIIKFNNHYIIEWELSKTSPSL